MVSWHFAKKGSDAILHVVGRASDANEHHSIRVELGRQAGGRPRWSRIQLLAGEEHRTWQSRTPMRLQQRCTIRLK